MSRPPIKAMESLKNYCEKTQCRRCVFGAPTAYNFIGCKLLDNPPCDWNIPIERSDEE